MRETFAGARLAANDISANVKDIISPSAALRRSFDVPNQTRRHPLQTVGSAVLLGYVIGSIRRSRGKRYDRRDNADSHHVQHGLSRGFLGQFGGEIYSLRRAAMRAIVKRSIKSVMHSVRPDAYHCAKTICLLKIIYRSAPRKRSPNNPDCWQ